MTNPPAQILITFDGESLNVKHPEDVILTLGMISLAEAEIKSQLAGHQVEPPPAIVVPKLKTPRIIL